MYGETSECGLDDHMDMKVLNGPNEIILHIDGRHRPEQLCVRGSLAACTAVSSRCMERLPNVMLTTMWP